MLSHKLQECLMLHQIQLLRVCGGLRQECTLSQTPKITNEILTWSRLQQPKHFRFIVIIIIKKLIIPTYYSWGICEDH